MKKFLFIIIPFFLFSCGSYSGIYTLDAYCNNINLVSNNGHNYIYGDSIIKITWVVSPYMMNFNLTNKTNKVIRVVWDEALFADINGNSSPVIHSGIRYMDMNNSHPATSITPYSSLSDMVQPIKNIYLDNIWSGWKQKPILPNSANTKAELLILRNKYIGKRMTVVLPIKIGDVTNEYVFYFNINDFVQKK